MTTVLHTLIKGFEAELLALRHTAPDSSALVDAINHLTWLIFYADPKRALDLCGEARRISLSHRYLYGYALCLRTEIEIYTFNGDVVTATLRAQEMEEVATLLQEPEILVCTKEEWSYLFWTQGDFAQALRYAQDAHELVSTLPLIPSVLVIEGRARLLNLMAINYMELGDTQSALTYCDAALSLYDEYNIGTTNQKALYYNNKAYHYYLLEQYEAGLLLSGIALQLCQDLAADGITVFTTPHAYDTLAALQMGLHNLTSAAVAITKGFESNLRHDHSIISMIAQAELACRQGQLFAITGNPTGAIVVLTQGLQLAERAGIRALGARCHLELSRAYQKLGQAETAFRHYETYYGIDRDTWRDRQDQRLRYIQAMQTMRQAQTETHLLQQKNAELEGKVIELQAARDRLRELSVRDTLTGLYNRRYAEEQLLSRFEEGNHFSIAIVDIDDFKHVNDSYRHKVGDDVLKRGAELLQHYIAANEWAARYGGEEFLLMLDRPLDEAISHCERVRQDIEAYGWHAIHPQLQVTVSIGVADTTEPDIEETLRLADRRLYEAKRRGKNRVVSD